MFPPRMVQLKSGIAVTFSDTEPMSQVIFQKDGDEENAEDFTLPLHYLKEKFGVLTLFEVMSSLENRRFTPEEYGRHIRSSYTGWEYRFEIYLDDGWVYVYRNRGSTQR